uniref:Uncharacterized protein n=1 Tax=Ananas comosus var. bracteatus TaxID=296719 RepID=A0A6V7NP52_ANACO|nr:unnamed protein product [Ananas comosus var. bracteatus]
MAPYEALYRRQCRPPICWDDVEKRQVIRPDLVEDAEVKIRIVRERLQTTQSRQRSYADQQRRDLEFHVDEHVLLKVSPSRRIKWFGLRNKLSPQFVGLFEILEHVGPGRTDWLFLRVSPGCTIYFTCRCFESIFLICPMLSVRRLSSYEKI